ncbi:MAG: S-methyl-5'-thioinosine phosphorylase [Sulfuritalea sp.]|nr:S-methyl-5'-thioinosine phosphorylase [Sulfuritalea sp.]
MLAIIGGSGLTELANLAVERREVVRTPYGEPSGPLTFGRICGQAAVFIARHGYGHTIPPHRVNYRANLWALKVVGASCVVSIASVGGIRADLNPGVIVIPHQIIDYTWGRKSTFHDGGGDAPVVHIDFTQPYDMQLRQALLDAADDAGQGVVDGGVYAAMQGPRLETAAEIHRLERDGADIVGMTGMPETALARELDLPYAAVTVVANHAAGRGESKLGIQFASLEDILRESMERVRRIIEMICIDGR